MDPQLKKLQQAIESGVAGLTAKQLSWHPAGKWCACEVLEHLYLTFTGTIKGFERVAQAGKPLTTRATWPQRVGRVVAVVFGHMPSGREAPRNVRPRGLAVSELLAGIGPKIAEMDAMVARCEEKFGKRTKLLDHPILGPLTGKEWNKFHLVHGLHHVKQIRRLRQGYGRG